MEILGLLAGVAYVAVLGLHVMGKVDNFMEQGEDRPWEGEHLHIREKKRNALPEESGQCEADFTLCGCWGCK